MARARTFSKAEIMDAARAAAETGLSARLCPNGEIIFTQEVTNEAPAKPSAWETWKKSRGEGSG